MQKEQLLDTGIFILRIGLGTIFLAHGLQKVFGVFGGPGIEGFTGMMKNLGFSFPVFWAWTAALGELLGGSFVNFGRTPENQRRHYCHNRACGDHQSP
ncbi:MAG: DoxX family protein [Candidatus Omnitrophota bacterium]